MANTLASAFTGRILASFRDPNSFEDVRGEHATMYPNSEADVATALKLCKEHDRDVIIRSGRNAVATDGVNGEGAVVINMDGLSDIRFEGSRVTVGSGVIMEKFANALYENGLFLPFRDALIKTVAAGVLSKEPGMLTRSAGLMRDYLHEIHVVKNDGTLAIASNGDDLFKAVLAKEADTIISRLVFNAIPEEEASKFWMSFLYLPYRNETFKKLMSSAFAGGTIPSTVDLSVKVTVAAHGIPFVRVSVAGKDGCSDREAVLRHVQQVVSERNLGESGFEISHATFSGKAIVKALLEGGDNGAFCDGRVSTKHTRLVHVSQYPDFEDYYGKVIESALGGDEDGVKFLPNVSMKAQVCLATDGNMSVTAYLFAPPVGASRHIGAEGKIDEYKRFLNHIIPLEKKPTVRRSLRPPPTGGHEIGFLTAIWANFDPRSLGSHFTLDPLNLGLKPRTQPIPGFNGEVYMASDNKYKEKAHQYATSSYPERDMSPHMVTYPTSVQDIQVAIDFGKREMKNIVARSGGHQYCGLSSGGNDTIVLSMDHFKDLSVHGNIATVGVGNRLTNIAALFRHKGVTIPHGECPYVAIGGHCQTGGYGHLLRSFGLALDYVQSFNIVLADRTFKTVYRPTYEVDWNDAENISMNDKIFWGVLGGGPNSFGILTEIKFEAISDIEHPYSRGHQSLGFFEKAPFRTIMEEVQKWSIEIEQGRTDYLPDDLDMMATAISLDIRNFFPGALNITAKGNGRVYMRGAILLEMVYGNEKGASESVASVQKAEALMTSIADDVKNAQSIVPRLVLISEKKESPLSYLSDSFVRRMGMTPDGREFIYPYEKRLNGTMHALTDGFVTGFVDLVDTSIRDRDVRIVFQMGFGGGKYAENATLGLTSCSRRDVVWQVVYDVFYTEGKKSVALHYQENMKDLLEREFAGEGESIRLIWGSYGDVDIHNVWSNYYDNEVLYKQLQGIKVDVDPTDVFHTRFTVALPA